MRQRFKDTKKKPFLSSVKNEESWLDEQFARTQLPDCFPADKSQEIVSQ